MISHLKWQFHGTRGTVAQISFLLKTLVLSSKTQEPQEVKMFIEENNMGKKDKDLHTLGASCFLFPPLRCNPELPVGVMHCLDLEGQQVHQAERMLKDGQIFHSLAYKRRGKSCSYIMEFRKCGNTQYRTVNCYLLARNTGYAVISMFQKQGNICSFGLEKQEKGILGKHFQAVKETPGTACIDCSDIVRRCVFCVFIHYQYD